jgi:hypothetical protein
MTRASSRRLLAGGVAGPAAFAGAWVWGSLTTDGYSMVGQPISRLAALGAPSRPVMTAGLLVFAGGVGAYAAAIRSDLPGRAWAAAAVSAAGSVAIAATPLEGPLGGNVHAGAAGIAYASLVALQLTGAGPLAERTGRAAVVPISRAMAAVSAACLAGNAFGPESVTGLFQRVGLTTGHAWIAASALALRRRRPA